MAAEQIVGVPSRLSVDAAAWSHQAFAARPSRFASPSPADTLLLVELFLSGFVEIKRGQDILKPGSQAEKGTFLGFETAFTGTEGPYPGGPFDFLGISRCAHLLQSQLPATWAYGRAPLASKHRSC